MLKTIKLRSLKDSQSHHSSENRKKTSFSKAQSHRGKHEITEKKKKKLNCMLIACKYFYLNFVASNRIYINNRNTVLNNFQKSPSKCIHFQPIAIQKGYAHEYSRKLFRRAINKCLSIPHVVFENYLWFCSIIIVRVFFNNV